MARVDANAADARSRLIELLVEHGYEPVEEPDGTLLLRNCPFDALVRAHRHLTCSMNLALLGGLTEELDGAGLEAAASPRDGFCCVALLPARQQSTQERPADW